MSIIRYLSKLNNFLTRKKFLKKSVISIYKYSSETTNSVHIDLEEDLTNDQDYNDIVKSCFDLREIHNCFIIQPYVKWGPKKLPISPQEQLEEAIALIKTLPSWNVAGTITIPLETLHRKKMFGSGNMEKLCQLIRKNPSITAVFINNSNLKNITTTILQENFGVKIFDRYRIVIQILKMNAISKHAKLQVALAELYFIQRKAQQKESFITHDPEKLKLIFQEREKLLKNAMLEVRNQRKLLRNKRNIIEYPVVAVVGYTNAGKTSLVKALTGNNKLQPRNQLFATLDITVHEGILPSGLKVLYVDTVGFISDIPTNLLECFVATLEDALLADVILHVEDLSSTCFDYKRKHVLMTIQQLASDYSECNITEKLLSVGNKCDILQNTDQIPDILSVSCKNGKGLEDLRIELENKILQLTSRLRLTIRVKNGGDEIRWLYKNSAVINEEADQNNPELTLARIIITKANLDKFKHYFVKN